MEKILPTHIVSVAGVVVNEKNEILMARTNDAGWVFPGGIVENGENIIDAVKREIIEETGIEIEVGELFCISSNTQKRKGYNGVKEIPTIVNMDFICKAIGGTLRNSEENSESAYISRENVLNMIEAPHVKERFKAFLEYNGRPMYLEYKRNPEFGMNLKRKI